MNGSWFGNPSGNKHTYIWPFGVCLFQTKGLVCWLTLKYCETSRTKSEGNEIKEGEIVLTHSLNKNSFRFLIADALGSVNQYLDPNKRARFVLNTIRWMMIIEKSIITIYLEIKAILMQHDNPWHDKRSNIDKKKTTQAADEIKLFTWSILKWKCRVLSVVGWVLFLIITCQCKLTLSPTKCIVIINLRTWQVHKSFATRTI